jgi:acyl-coenzyme A thioesterase PaaI-like protein
MTLLDVVMAHAARSPGDDGVAEHSGVVTVEMKTSFLRPGLGRLVGTGRRLHRTASMAFCGRRSSTATRSSSRTRPERSST